MKTKLRFLSLFLSLILALTCLSGMTQSVLADEPEVYSLWVGGVQVTGENANDVFGDGKVRFTPAEGEQPAILELNNYSYTGEGSLVEIGGFGVAAAVFYNEEAPVEVHLKGENTLTLEDREALPYNTIALFLRTADAVILGEDDSSLTATCGTSESVSSAVAGKGDLRIEGLTLTATNTESEAYSYGVYAGKGLTLVSSEVRAESGKAANGSYSIYTLGGSLVIDDCEIEAISGEANFSIAINGGDELITINNSEVTATATDAVNSSHAIDTYKDCIVIKGSTVKATAGDAASRADAIYAGHSISVADSEVEAVGGSANYSMGLVVFTEGVSITHSQVYTEGAPAAYQSAGIYAETDIEILNGSTVEAIGGNATDEESATGGFLAFGTVTVKDSTVKAIAGEAFESYGICGYDWIEDTSEKRVTVLNSNLYALSNGGTYSYGIYTNTLTVGADIEKFEAIGQSGAVYGAVKNAIEGLGWTELAANSDSTVIQINEEGAELPDFKRVVFQKLIENPFEDVAEDAYYYDPVLWAVEQGVTFGTSSTTFSPNDKGTRAQVVTFLWRAAGSPEPTTTECKFTDVKAGSYYEKAVLWAAETGVTAGTSETTFSPDNHCTRGQVVTFLWRAAGSPEPTTTECKFTDVKAGSYYEKAVLWAAETGVTAGTSETTFSPDDPCTRAQAVTFLYRDLT